MTTADQNQAPNLDGVPNYNDVTPEQRVVMDQIMATIDPYNINTIIAFGREPLEKLAGVAAEVMRRSDTDSAMFGTLDALQDRMGSMDIGELAAKAADLGARGAGWVMKNPGTALVSLGASTVLGPLALVGVPFAKGKLDEMKTKREGGDVADQLRKTIAQSQEVISELERARHTIPLAIESLDQLGKARATAYGEVSIFIGAGMERLRRLQQEEIPAMADKASTSADYDDSLNLEALNTAADMLSGRINDMLASRLVSQATMATLMRLKGVFATAAGKVESHMTLSVPQWQAQMAESGVVLAGYKVAKAIKQADEFGNRVLVQGAQVSQRTHALMDQSSRTGTYDSQRVIGVLTSMAQQLQDDARLIGSRRGELERDRKALSDASAAFRDKVTAMAEGQGALRIGNGVAGVAAALEDHSGRRRSANQNDGAPGSNL